MISVCFYFEVHQPFRLRPYGFFDIGEEHDYFDNEKNRAVVRKVAEKCYIPMTELLLKLVKKYPRQFYCTFSISGVAMEQFKMWAPQVMDNFRCLVESGQVELLAETYYHSLAALFSEKEFQIQVRAQMDMIKREFGGYAPTSFRNTELIFNNHVAWLAQEMGFRSILLEGTDKVLQWRSPNFVYQPKHSPGILALCKNFRLSDDIAFRFSDRNWAEWPLTVERFAQWIHSTAGSGTNVNLFMDFETFGEHQWADTGIFQFMEELPQAIFRHPDFAFKTVTEVARSYPPVGMIETDAPISWADSERDLSAWLGNSMQREAIHALYALEDEVMAAKNLHLIHTFRKLQTSDHFYYMCTKYFSDGDVHKYFSPYSSPYDAYIYFMNALQDFRSQLTC